MMRREKCGDLVERFLFSIPCQPVPIPSSLLLNRDHLELLRFAWSNSIFASNSVQSRILHFRGWSKVGTHPGEVWSCSAPNWEIRGGKKNQEKGGKGSWGNLNSQHSVPVKCLKGWSCVSSNQPTASIASCPPSEPASGGFPWELFSLGAGNSCCRMGENPGELMVGGMSVREEQDLKACG